MGREGMNFWFLTSHLPEELFVIFGSECITWDRDVKWLNFAFLDESLELWLFSLLFVQTTDVAFVDTLAKPVIIAAVVLVTLRHIIDELQGVKQDVFLTLIELQIGLKVMVWLSWYLANLTEVDFFLQYL